MESSTLHKLSTLSTYSFCIVRTLHNPIKKLWRVQTLHNFFAYVIKCMLYLKKVFFCVPGLGESSTWPAQATARPAWPAGQRNPPFYTYTERDIYMRKCICKSFINSRIEYLFSRLSIEHII